MSFTLASLHLLLMLFCLIGGKCAKSVNENGFTLKFIFVVGLFIGLHFVNNDFFYSYFQVSKYISILFLLFQVLMLIDLFYLWAEQWVANYNRDQECYKYLLLSFTVILIALYIYLGVIIFQHFTGPTSIVLSCISIMIAVLFIVMIICRVRENGSVLTALALNLYSLYVMWSGLGSNNDPS